MLGRFTQPDTLVPEPGNPQALNRYSYGRNNPLTYIDDDGHLPIIPILIAGGIIALKVVDWGWTAWDSYQSLRVMNDPSASQAAKAEAAANLAMTAAFEAAEPDDLLLVALPIDDLARKGILKLGREAGQEAAEQAGKEIAQEATGQWHHLLSKKILDQLGKHETLRGVFTKEDFLTQAANKASHWGYDKWHRAYDKEVVDWLVRHPEATPEEFLKFLQEIYSRPEVQEKFPEAVELLKKVLEGQP